MKKFLFDLGNSTIGSIGMVAWVQAETPEAALTKLQDAVPEWFEVCPSREVQMVVYLNMDAVTVSDAELDSE